MGWNTVTPPPGSTLFRGLDAGARFYFVHSYAAHATEGEVTWAVHGEPFVAAVERGPVSATQFHPEKSADAGAALLENWLATLRVSPAMRRSLAAEWSGKSRPFATKRPLWGWSGWRAAGRKRG